VKTVDDVDGLKEEALANRAVGRPHVEANRLDLSAELRSAGQHVQGDVPVQVDQHAAVASLALAVVDFVNAQPPHGGVAGGQVEAGPHLPIVDPLDGLRIHIEQRAYLGEGLLGAAVKYPSPGDPVCLAVAVALAGVGESQPFGEVAIAVGAKELPHPH